jgi:hypothetical protein
MIIPLDETSVTKQGKQTYRHAPSRFFRATRVFQVLLGYGYGTEALDGCGKDIVPAT